MEDSGAYKVQNNDGPQTVDMTYQLTVYSKYQHICTWLISERSSQHMMLLRPNLSPTYHRPSTQTSGVQQEQGETQLQCAVLCGEWERAHPVLAQRGADTVLHQQLQSQHPLSLPLEIEENSAPYSCVTENPARKEIFLVNPEEYCYESVWKPHIKTSASQGGRSCSLQCSVQNGRELTLSWRTEGETLSHTRDPNLSTLSLTLEIEASNSTYTCVATNPVSEERTAFLPTQVCGQEGHCSHDAVLYVMFVLRLVEFALVTLAVFLLLRLHRQGRILAVHSPRRRSCETVTEL
ncbi:hypothetical protein COCON_G00100870 [Conger conger]|uniref:Ig-like domain-containing protein n=1 Tax=Conger conger TaxID=82655 RepID=A0A9Q1HYH4_CONCO|nr:hypothetical protein COCON_G00100870 [Conger conger]